MDPSDRRRRSSVEAATWWVRLHSEELAKADREQFVDWLRESAVHVAEMLRVAKVHNALTEFQGWVHIANGPDDRADADADANNENVVSLPHAGSVSSLRSLPSLSDFQIKAMDAVHTRPSPRRQWIGAVAAGLAAIALAGLLWFSGLTGQTIQTDRGERREVALPDGSILEVDPQTRLRVAFDDHVRRVTLDKGRALFRVAKNPTRPFLVQADGTTVRAVGTAFGVEHGKQGSVIVTVAEGKVAVERAEYAGLRTGSGTRNAQSPLSSFLSPQSSQLSPPQSTTLNSYSLPSSPQSSIPLATVQPRAVFVSAGQQVRMPSSGTVEPVRTVNSDRELAWARGQLVLDNESVADAVEEFNRYNKLQLHVTSEGLGQRTVSGVFDSSDPESFIGFLQTVTSVKVTRGESQINMQ